LIFFPFSSLNILLYTLLAYIISNEKVLCNSYPCIYIGNMALFPLWIFFNICFLVFYSLDMTFLDVDCLTIYSILALLGFTEPLVFCLQLILEIYWSLLLKYFSLRHCFLLCLLFLLNVSHTYLNYSMIFEYFLQFFSLAFNIWKFFVLFSDSLYFTLVHPVYL
jgi:hypothetical protein